MTARVGYGRGHHHAEALGNYMSESWSNTTESLQPETQAGAPLGWFPSPGKRLWTLIAGVVVVILVASAIGYLCRTQQRRSRRDCRCGIGVLIGSCKILRGKEFETQGRVRT